MVNNSELKITNDIIIIMRKPTDGYVYFPYGATTAPYSPSNPHAGVDYTARTGDNIYAPHSGRVVLSQDDLGPCGKAIDIEGGRYKSRLCHNSIRLFSVGAQVSEGQVVAKAGASGNATGPHCHWVLWVNGVRVDPVKYLGGGNMPASQDKVDDLAVRLEYNTGLMRQPSEQEIRAWVDKGVTMEELQRSILNSAEHKELMRLVQAGQNLASAIGDDDEAQIKEAQAKLVEASAKLQEAIND